MTAALMERDRLEEVDAAEDVNLEDDLEDDGPPPVRQRDGRRTEQQLLRQSISAQHSTTQAGLLELVSKALAAKVAHDVDAHPLALEALDAFTAAATTLRAVISTEQQTIRDTKEDHR
jgi:hypothetical protein